MIILIFNEMYHMLIIRGERISVINFDNRKFVSVENTTSGEVSSKTYFHYKQEGNILYADYLGGEILKGKLIGIVHEDDSLEFRYNHVNTRHEIRGGKCKSIPKLTSEGKIELYEKWQWLDREQNEGESLIREV